MHPLDSMEKVPTDSPVSFVERTSSTVKITSTTTANYTLVQTAATVGLSLSLPRCLSLSKRSEAARGEHLPSQDSPQMGRQRARSVAAPTESIVYHCPLQSRSDLGDNILSPFHTSLRPFVHLSVGPSHTR